MRNLASIQRVWKIEPIEGADKIELAHVLGWQCVVKKGEFKEGDLGIYFEVDSFLPERECFEFLRSTSYKNNEYMGKGFRLKTQKFRGQISQGLILPLDLFAEELKNEDHMVGQDVSDALGVRKWEMPETIGSSGIIIGDRPDCIPKTDETRIQNVPELLQEFSNIPYYITTKLDGTSCSVGIDEDGAFHMTGHNFEFKDETEVSGFVRMIRERKIEEKLRAYTEKNPEIRSIVMQGELCGEGIQKNRLKLKTPNWFVFTVNINRKRTDLQTLKEVCKAAEVDMVPIEEEGIDLPEKYSDVEALLKRAEGQYPNGGPKEGIVIRPVEPVFSKTLSGSLSMKVINNKYLLKHDE